MTRAKCSSLFRAFFRQRFIGMNRQIIFINVFFIVRQSFFAHMRASAGKVGQAAARKTKRRLAASIAT
jgi:hypothetical protein